MFHSPLTHSLRRLLFALVCGLLAPLALGAWQAGASLTPPGAAPLKFPEQQTGVTPTHALRLKSREFQPGAPDRAALRTLARSDGGRLHLLVQLDFIPRAAAKAEYERRGLRLLDYVPDFGWIASVPGAAPEGPLGLPGVTWAGALRVEDKLDPDIMQGAWGAHNRSADGTVAVYVVTHADVPFEAARGLAAKHGARVMSEVSGVRALVVEMHERALAALAAEDDVQWIEPAELPLGEANDGIRTTIGVTLVHLAPYNLTGAGVDILIYDSGTVTPTHADFSGRLIIGDATPVRDHSTHVAGTAGGSGALSAGAGGAANQWKGMAPGADIISYGYQRAFTGTMLFYNDPGDIQADWASAQNTYGADVGNASLSSNIYANYPLSCTLMGNYGLTSALMDQIVRGGNATVGVGDRFIATWAAGNERGSGSSCGTYSTMSPPASAKNLIHVGASTDADSMSTFSSWGPTDDGRIKPTIVAPGVNIMSTIPNMFADNNSSTCGASADDYCYPYDTLSGTSMASPAVAGSIALMLQQYRTTYATTGNFWPSTARAILMQTAKDLGNPGPDYQWGYGRVDIKAAVDLIRARGFLQRDLSQGDIHVFRAVVTDTSKPLLFSLAWDDYEATFNANPTLINNLDLEVELPTGVITRPWVLNAAAPATNATRAVNNVDNQEQVSLTVPVVGTYLVRVKGTSVPQGPQEYSLACAGCTLLSLSACSDLVGGALALAAPVAAPDALPADSEEGKLTGTPMLPVAPRPPEAGETRSSEDGAIVAARRPARPSSEAPSAGELWQRALEQTGVDPAAMRATQERTQAALREFDAARNAGPEAVLAFDAKADATVRALIAGEVAEAQQTLEARTAPPVPAIPQAPAALRVGIDGACAYSSIQAAVNAATNGATIRVFGDYYHENIDILGGKVITIWGGWNASCTAVSGTTATVEAAAASSVVDLTGGSVVLLRNLTLRWGSSFGAGVDLLNSSHVTLDNTQVESNHGASGGGIYVGSGSAVTLTNGSNVRDNSSNAGGGAIVYGRLMGLDTTSDVTGNCSTTDGGGIYASGGEVLLSNSDVHANRALGATGRGGAIFATNGATVTLSNSSFIGESAPCCNIAYDGAGIYATDSTIVSLGGDTSILRNDAVRYGGGLYLTNGSHFRAASNTNVGYEDSPANGNQAVLGAGIYIVSSTLDFSGRIINNIAANSGGGLYADQSTLTLTNAVVGGLGAFQHNQIGPAGLNGAGMYLFNNTHATLSNTLVTSNTMSNSSTGYGGGIYIRQGSILTATNSSIENHFLPSAADGRGAGLYIYDASVTLSNTLVQSNTTKNLGGGARLFGTSRLDVLGGGFVNNRSLGGPGGGIAATNLADINVVGGALKYNQASTDGGALYLDAGTADFTGAFDVRFNAAGGNGGAVAVSGSGDVDFNASGGMSLLAVNDAGGSGGALYVGNADNVTLYATSGESLLLNTNKAGAHGGAVASVGGGLVDVYGQVQATSNLAVANGGVFYLANGSQLWLDDFGNVRPQLLVNTAANGGAVYASNSPRVECDAAVLGADNNGNTASGSGGAVYVSGSVLIADNCIFRNNTAQAGNGGAIAGYTSTVRIDTDYTTPVAASRPAERVSPSVPAATACNPQAQRCSELNGNSAISSTVANGNGGAIYANAVTLTVQNTYLHRNLADRGGAIYQEGGGAKSDVTNTLAYSNTSRLAFGAGIRNAGGAMTLTNATLAYNVGGAGFSPGGASSYVYNTIIWGNSQSASGALTAATCNIDQGGTAGPALDPLFVSPGGEDYRVQAGSPAIDACTSGAARDILNRARPVGTRFDMGVYELTRIFLPLIRR